MRKPEDCVDMTEIREEIDAIDGDLVALLARRARYIDRAADIKRAANLPANIPSRVEAVVEKVRSAAGENGLDADLAEALWRQLIEWSIEREERHLAES